MNITINLLELASELAHKELVENWEESIQIFKDQEADVLEYTEEAQDLFNELYDKQYDFVKSFENSTQKECINTVLNTLYALEEVYEYDETSTGKQIGEVVNKLQTNFLNE